MTDSRAYAPLGLLLLGAFLGCGCQPEAIRSRPTEPTSAVLVRVPAATSSVPVVPVAPGSPRVLADDAALEEGLVSFVGMVRPTKGGLEIRGVVLSFEQLGPSLAQGASSKLSHDDMLGMKLRIVAELVRVRAQRKASGPQAVQQRAGTWFRVKALRDAQTISLPVMIEGSVARSKGLFSVSKHLVDRRALNWSLKGEDPVGKKVRLWGQPRTVICHPQAQCLLGGSLPMFDVARAEFAK